MEGDRDIAGAATWLIAANGLWLLGGVLAYFTHVSLAIVTAVAAAPAVIGLLEARAVRSGRAEVWADRALSYAVGTWVVMGMAVLVPYVATEQGLSLWASRGFAGTTTLLASAGVLAWNVAAVHAVADRRDREALRSFAAFHLLAIGAAAYYLWAGDGTTAMLELRGDEIAAVDLEAVPLLAAMPGMLWAIVHLRARAQA